MNRLADIVMGLLAMGLVLWLIAFIIALFVLIGWLLKGLATVGAG